MAKVEYGSITVLSTGNKVPLLADSSLQVQKVVLFIASSATETSAGFSDLTTTFTGGSAYGDENDTKTISHYRNIGGTKTLVFEGTITVMTTGMFTINVSTCTQTTSLKFVVFGV